MPKTKSKDNSYEKVEKTKKETILIEILPSTNVEEKDGKTFIDGFEHIHCVHKYGKTYAKCYNRKQ